ncbi:caspase family protein [Kitasatospora sp. NPDC101235]|uniref:caspase, EACC1-associated type n=1 Tax=Kitasatospora sp. NPDC101235 TaxID=3364101 RepID=UPI0037FFA306
MSRLPDPRKSRAVLLGTSAFHDRTLPALPAVANNLSEMRNILVSEAGTGLLPGSCWTYLDAPLAVLGPALAAAASQAEDMLLIYYAGHGLIGDDGELYLGLPDTHADRELIAWTALPFPLVRRRLATARAANRILILDCCFSGRATASAMTDSTSIVAAQLDVAGTYTLASSPANRTSSAPVGAEHTAFTGALIRIIRHGSELAPDLLTLNAIYEGLYRQLSAADLPRPEQRNTRTAANLALARNHRRTADTQSLRQAAARLARLGDEAGAESLYRQAVSAGDVEAMADLARFLHRRADGQAMLWRRKAAEAGHAASMLALGRYYQSIGMPDEARSWFERADIAETSVTDDE